MRRSWLPIGVVAGVLLLSWSLPFSEAQAPAGNGQPAAQGGRGARGGDPAGQEGGRGGRAGRGGRGGRGAAAATTSKPTPRGPDGRVNLGQVPGVKGFWNNASGSPIGGALPGNLTLDQVPFQDWARELYAYRRSRGGLDDPHARCQPAGGMRFFTVPNGMEIIDQPELQRIFIIAGENRDWRRIAMEPGRKHPPEDVLIPSYFGDSIGWWEGDTLVVDTVGYNDKFWFDSRVTPHSEQLHTVERWTRVNFGTMINEFLLDDPGAFSRPVKLRFTATHIRPDLDMMEFICLEDNQYGVAGGFTPAQPDR